MYEKDESAIYNTIQYSAYRKEKLNKNLRKKDKDNYKNKKI